jgi:hypothetical protein
LTPRICKVRRPRLRSHQNFSLAQVVGRLTSSAVS